MPNFDRDALRKGAKAIDEALESRGNGEFRPFLGNIFWSTDKESKYLLFLNPIEEIPQVEYHPYIDLGDNVPHSIMARTDKSIGERTDPIHEEWNYKPRLTNLAVAVELEATTKLVNGREKPAGFEVAVRSFERKVRDDDGEDTGETEEVFVPLVGLVAQSPFNFFNALRSFDAEEDPLHTTPIKVTRLGQKENVNYQVAGYAGLDLDLTNLFECVGNMSYMGDDAPSLEDLDSEEACTTIGDYLLYKRINELADEELYNEILGGITKPAKFGDTKKEKGKSTRRPKQSQRRQATETEEPAEVPAEEVTKESPADKRLAKLHERAAKARKPNTE